jgi:type VI secretion system protein ImpH
MRDAPGSVPPGENGPAAAEPVRFRPHASLGFAARDVETLEWVDFRGDVVDDGDESARWRMTVNFHGLYGPASPMPAALTEEILWYVDDHDPVRDFLDIFHHRAISFVYRAWRKYRHHEQYEVDPYDAATRRCLALAGLPEEMHPACPFDPLGVLRDVGLLWDVRRSVGGLEGILRDQFPGIRIRVDAAMGRVVEIPREQRSRLARHGSRLGEDATIGGQTFDLTGAFRVSLGPLSVEEYQAFFPGEARHTALVRLIRFYVSDPLECSIRLLLRGGEIPGASLEAERKLGLGKLCFLAPEDPDDHEVVVPGQERMAAAG